MSTRAGEIFGTVVESEDIAANLKKGFLGRRRIALPRISSEEYLEYY